MQTGGDGVLSVLVKVSPIQVTVSLSPKQSYVSHHASPKSLYIDECAVEKMKRNISLFWRYFWKV